MKAHTPKKTAPYLQAGVPRNAPIRVRFTEEERRKINLASDRTGISVAEKIRPYILKWADKVLRGSG